MMEFIDTHAHLNDEKFTGEIAEAIERAQQNAVTAIINFGDTMESSTRVAALAKEYAPLFAGVGVHPEEAFPMTGRDDDALAELTQNKKVVAIGEIGLDYYWEKDSEKRLLQQKIFVRQLDLARQLHLPICIHDRDAHGDTLAILKKEGKGLSGVLHCFSGSLEIAREVFKLGFFVGFDGPLTFKNAAKLPEIAAKAPKDMILIETDSPYMAPTPMRGKRNEPAYVRHVAEFLAKYRECSLEEIAQITTQNARNLYNLVSDN